MGSLDVGDGFGRRSAAKMDGEIVPSKLVPWRWRNEEVFRGVHLSVQEKLQQVVNCFEKDRSVFEDGDPRAGEMRDVRSN